METSSKDTLEINVNDIDCRITTISNNSPLQRITVETGI